MKLKHKKKSEEHVELAEEHIIDLFRQADETPSDDIPLANRYVQLARKIAMKFKVKLPVELKRKFCKHCHAYFRPGLTCRVRLAKQRKIYYCLVCKKYTRVPYKPSRTA